MSTQRVFVARLAGCTVFDPAGDRLGKVRDVVVIYRASAAPRVVGLVVEIPGRRHVFVSIGRVTSIQSGQVIEFSNEEIEKLQHRVAEQLGYKLVGHRLELYAVPLAGRGAKKR